MCNVPCEPLTSPRRRQVPRLWMTSSARSEWSESHTSPMDTISGEFIRTRRIRSTSPQLLCDEERKDLFIMVKKKASTFCRYWSIEKNFTIKKEIKVETHSVCRYRLIYLENLLIKDKNVRFFVEYKYYMRPIKHDC